MSKYFMLQDQQKCIGCHSCEIQCKSNKELPNGPNPCQIVPIGPEMINDVPRASYIFMPCFHCENPWCVAACPTGAMKRRSKDGIVFVDADLCVGCKTCITACPWGAPQWNPEIGKVVKCDYCMDRIDQGLKPACVTTCLTHCLSFGPTEQMPLIKRERYAKAMAASKGAAIHD
jgi:Fe-S-cluster-containing dehydrogenase component